MKYNVPMGKTFTPLQMTGYYQSTPGSSQRITAAILANIAQVGPVQRQLRQLSLLGFPGFDFNIMAGYFKFLAKPAPTLFVSII